MAALGARMAANLVLALHAGRLQREPTSLTLVEQSANGPVLHSPGLGNPDRVIASTKQAGSGPNGHTAEDAGPWSSGERTVRDRSRAIQREVSCGGCGAHGNCDTRSGICSCQMGWGGPHCSEELFPSCRLSPAPPDVAQPGNSLVPMCASLRRLSPVACECIAECLRHGHEVCAPGSYGCLLPWKEPARGGAGKRKGTTDVATRDGFHSDLPCLATPAGATPHSGLPPPPGTRLVSFAAYAAQGTAARGEAVSSSSVLNAYGAGRSGHEARPVDAVWRAEAACGVKGCSARGRCLQSSAGGGKGRGTQKGGEDAGGADEGGATMTATATPPPPTTSTMSCVCVDGAYGPACELGCENDCFNGCSGHGTCVHGWCRCDTGWFGTDPKPKPKPNPSPSPNPSPDTLT